MRTAVAGVLSGLILLNATLARADQVPPPGTPVTAQPPATDGSGQSTVNVSPVTPSAGQPTASEAADLLPIPFKFTFHGFIRGGYAYVPYNGQDSQLIGRDSGFRLYDSRLEFSGAFGKWVDFVISVDAFSNIDPNTGLAPIAVGFADAYTTLHLGSAYLRLGQFKTPFNGEFLLDDQYIPFARRSAVSEGLLVDEATTPEAPISLDRQLGAMIGGRIALGEKLGLNLALAAVNGNGPNQARNDNSKIAVVGRAAIGTDMFSVGASGYWNQRSQGTLAERQDEEDYAGDLDVLVDLRGFHFGGTPAGLKLFGMATYKHSAFLTVPQNQPINSLGTVASASLPIEAGKVVVEPALRWSYFQPDSTLRTPSDSGSGASSAFAISDYTVGVNVSPRVVPLRFQLNYTYRSADPIWGQPSTLVDAVLQANF